MSNLNINTSNAVALNTQNSITMTSLEIVDLINAHRQEQGNTTALRHAHFMTKVPQVLGSEVAPKFSGSSFYQGNGSAQLERSIYIFPKREACLMAMSYSYELQAQIFDRMTTLEQQLLLLNRPSYMIDDPVERAKKWIEETTAKQEAETKLLETQKVVELQTPKVEVFDAVLDKERTYTVREFAQRTGVKEKDVKAWIVDKRWATGASAKSFRPAAWANTHNYMRMIRSGRPFTTVYGTTCYNESIVFTQEGFNEAVRKMVKSGIMQPLKQGTE